eukprot:3562515-Prymnesium_polylepis.3
MTPCELVLRAEMNAQSVEYTQKQEPWVCRAMTQGLISTQPERDHPDIYLISLLIATQQFSGGMGVVYPETVSYTHLTLPTICSV